MKIVNCHTHFVLPSYYKAVVEHHADKKDGFPMPTRWSIEKIWLLWMKQAQTSALCPYLHLIHFGKCTGFEKFMPYN